MSSGFIGRRRHLRRLDDHLAAVEASGRGRLVTIQGRRQVGKSTLVTEFLRRHDVASLFFTASRQPTVSDDLERFATDVARESSLPGARTLLDSAVTNWEAALRLVAGGMLPDAPAVLVFDELPWLLENDPGLDGTLQKLWDTVFEARPVLLVLVGSDISMMEALVAHDRPLFGRTATMVVQPFDPADTAEMLAPSASAVDAIDAYLVTGGYPRLLVDLGRRRMSTWLRDQFADDTSALLVTGERIVAGELPDAVQARQVLDAVGTGERTFSALAQASGLSQVSLNRSLRVLGDVKRVVARDRPVGPGAPDAPRYRVADPYLRFWLRFCQPAVADAARGRGDLALGRWEAGWPEYRGRAVEPVVHEALTRLAADDHRLGGAGHVGGWWNRTNNPEIDIVGVDRAERPRRAAFTGTIKWRANQPLGDRDVAAHRTAMARVPALAGAPVVAVAPTRITAHSVDASFTAEDLLAAWR